MTKDEALKKIKELQAYIENQDTMCCVDFTYLAKTGVYTTKGLSSRKFIVTTNNRGDRAILCTIGNRVETFDPRVWETSRFYELENKRYKIVVE